jgi:undecaprenyl pyrophosphate synthase
MNSKQKQMRINECMKLLDNSFRRDLNSIRINVTNDLRHEIAKLIKSYELVKDKKKILTEVIFKNGSRADILCLDDFRVFEILNSETEKEALEKVKKYPQELDIVLISADEIIDY